MALPQIDARPTREGSGLGPLSRSEAGVTDELVHAVHETVDPPLLPCPAHGDTPGAVAGEAAVHLGALVAGVRGVGGEVRQTGCTEGPIVVDLDMHTDDDSRESRGEPDGTFTV